MGIKVKATQRGVYGHLREAGDVFEVKDEKQVSSRWMARIDSGKSEASKKGGKGKEKSEPEASSDEEVASDSEVI